MFEEEELQRRELARLLSTAKDKDRQELIRKAIQALDEQEKIGGTGDDEILFSANDHHLATVNPATQSSLLGAQSIPTLETYSLAQQRTESTKARMRPMSARRRTSVPNLLDAIPEVIARNSVASPHKGPSRKHDLGATSSSSGSNSSSMGFGNSGINRSVSSSGDDSIMPYEDVAEVIASSYDGRFPPKIVFKHSYKTAAVVVSHGMNHHMSAISEDEGNFGVDDGYFPYQSNNDGHDQGQQSANNWKGKSHSRSQCWVSTGLTPQFLSVVFFEKWIVKKVEVRCAGIVDLSLQINPNASSTVSSSRLIDMRPIGHDFVWDAAGNEETFDTHGGGIPGIGLTFVLRKTSNLFIRISEVKVTVFPYS